MQKERAIPEGYMTVGELANKIGTTVRTLQYYDQEGVLSPSAESIGGRRLYTYKDMIRLHQILSLKSLGFSLSDIKDRLISLNTPAEVADILAQQASVVKEKIEVLSESLNAIEALKEEVLQMQTVDFKKYADIIINLQLDNEYYWLIKHFDSDTLDHIRSRFDIESGRLFMDRFNQLNEDIIALKKSGIAPDDEKAQRLAEQFWNMVMEFTDGDLRMLPKLMKFGNLKGENRDWVQKQTIVNEYIQPALNIYLSKIGVNPFKEVR